MRFNYENECSVEQFVIIKVGKNSILGKSDLILSSTIIF